jgi:hypothetical protein
MPGGVQHDEGTAAVLDLVCADVLGDPARLLVDHVACPDRIEQQCLPVVDVAHDRNHGGPGNEVLVTVDFLIDETFHLGGDVFHLEPVLLGEKTCRVGVEKLIQRGGHPHLDQPLDHFPRLDPHPVGQIADGDDLFDLEHALARLRRAGGGNLLLPYGFPPPSLDADRLELAYHRSLRLGHGLLFCDGGDFGFLADLLDDVLFQYSLLDLLLMRFHLLPLLFLFPPLLLGLRGGRGFHHADGRLRSFLLLSLRDQRFLRGSGSLFRQREESRLVLRLDGQGLRGRGRGLGRHFRFGCAPAQHHPARLPFHRPVRVGHLLQLHPGGRGRRSLPEVAPHSIDQVAFDVARRGFPFLPDALQEQQDLLAVFLSELLGKLPYANLVHPLPLRLRYMRNPMMRHSSVEGNKPPGRFYRLNPSSRSFSEASRWSARECADEPIRQRAAPFRVRILLANPSRQPVLRQR